MEKENNWIKLFNEICQAPNLYLSERVSRMKFKWCKISIMRYVFVEIFGLFCLTPKTPEWTQQWQKLQQSQKPQNRF